MKVSKKNFNKDRVYSNHKRDNKVSPWRKNIGLIVFSVSIVSILILIIYFMSVIGKIDYEKSLAKEKNQITNEITKISERNQNEYNSFADLMQDAEVIRDLNDKGKIIAVGWRYKPVDESYEAVYKIDKFGIKHEQLKFFVSDDITIEFKSFQLEDIPEIKSERCEIDCYYSFQVDNDPQHIPIKSLTYGLLTNMHSKVTLNEFQDGEILETYIFPKMDSNYNYIRMSYGFPKVVGGENFARVLDEFD